MTEKDTGQTQLDLGAEFQQDLSDDSTNSGGESYWHEQAAKAERSGANDDVVAWYQRMGAQYEKILHSTIRGDVRHEVPGVGSAPFDQIRYWMRMHGSDNDFAGMRDDLVEASNLIAERAPEKPGSVAELQSAMIDASSSLMIAANVAEGQDRIQLLSGARDVLSRLDDTVANFGPAKKEELNDGLDARAEMMRDDIGFTQLIEVYNDPATPDEVKQKISGAFEAYHASSIANFRHRLSTGNITPQMSAEWYATIDARHQLMRSNEHLQRRVRGAYPHERRPATLHGSTDMRPHNEAFSMITEVYRDKKWDALPDGRTNIRLAGVVLANESDKILAPNINPVVIENNVDDKDFQTVLASAAGALERDLEMKRLHGDWQDLGLVVRNAMRHGHELVTTH